MTTNTAIRVGKVPSPQQRRRLALYRYCAFLFAWALFSGQAYAANPEFELAWTTTLRAPVGANVAFGLAGDIERVNNLVFYGTEGGLLVFDVADRFNAVWLSDVPTEGWIRSIALANGVAYLVDSQEGLITVDVSDPNRIRRLDSLYVGDGEYGGPRAVALLNNRAYVGVDNEGLAIVDISDPTRLVLVRHADLGARVSDISISEGRGLAILGVLRDTVVELDFSSPDTPRKVGEMHLLSLLGEMEFSPQGWELDDGGMVYDCSWSSIQDTHHHHFWSLRNFAMPVYAGGFISQGDPLIPGQDGIAYSTGLTWDENVILAVQLAAYRFPRRGNPRLLGACDTIGEAWDVVVSGRYAYVADAEAGLQVIDISNPANPQRVGSYDTGGLAYGVAVSGSYAYIADQHAGLQVIDITNPANPQRVGGYQTRGRAYDVAAVDQHAYVAASDGGLEVVWISEPANPRVVGVYGEGGNPIFRVDVSGNHAFVVDGRATLEVIDVGNPSNPHRVGVYNAGLGIVNVTVFGSYAYGIGQNNGLEVIDVSDPANPRLIGSCSIGASGGGVAASGNYAYVAAWYTGLFVIDIHDPANPRWIGHYGNKYFWGPRVTAHGDNVYVADERGLTIFGRFRPLIFPSISTATPGGPVTLELSGPPSSTVRLQRSVNLREWEDWVVFPMGEQPTNVGDPEASSVSRRFYRAFEE